MARRDLGVGGREHLLDVDLEAPLPALESRELPGRHERDRVALSPRASRAPDAVGVDLRAPGEVEVDHVSDVVDVDASGRDVRGHDHAQAAVSEPTQDPLTQGLAQVAVQRVHGEPPPREFFGHLGAALPGAGEDERRAARLRLKDAHQGLELVALGHAQEPLLDVVDHRAAAAALDLDRLGIVERLRGDALDLRGHGGREHGDLPVLRRGCEQPLDVLEEPLPEHLVGLVHDHHLDLREVEAARVEQIEQAPRRAHDHGDARLERLELGPVGGAAVDRRHPDAVPAAQLTQGLRHLDGQLTRGCEDQGAQPRSCPPQAVEQGEPERGRLARPGARPRDQVAAAQQRGDRGRLDRSRGLEPEALEGGEERGVEAQRVEGGLWFVGVARGLHGRGNALISRACQRKPGGAHGTKNQSSAVQTASRPPISSLGEASMPLVMTAKQRCWSGRTRTAVRAFCWAPV